jgi:aryl-alcohol dehydrogenase-like predicted oxidoreductase
MIFKIILGTVQLGLDYGINNSLGKPSKEAAHALLKVAFNRGIKTLDTAEAYGNSEELIGNYHRKSSEKFSVITKFHVHEGKEASEIIDNALTRLGVNSIETLFFHSFRDYHSNPLILKELVKEVERGRIGELGVSVYTNNEIEALLPVEEIKVIQAPFNLLDNHSKRAEVFDRAKLSGKKVHIRSIFLQGLFFRPLHNLPEKLMPLKPALERIHQITKTTGLSMTTLAVKYALSKDYIDGVLVGVDSVAQLNENLNTIEEVVPDRILSQIDMIVVENQRLLNPTNW